MGSPGVRPAPKALTGPGHRVTQHTSRSSGCVVHHFGTSRWSRSRSSRRSPAATAADPGPLRPTPIIPPPSAWRSASGWIRPRCVDDGVFDLELIPSTPAGASLVNEEWTTTVTLSGGYTATLQSQTLEIPDLRPFAAAVSLDGSVLDAAQRSRFQAEGCRAALRGDDSRRESRQPDLALRVRHARTRTSPRAGSGSGSCRIGRRPWRPSTPPWPAMITPRGTVHAALFHQLRHPPVDGYDDQCRR